MRNLLKNIDATITEARNNNWGFIVENRPKFKEISALEEYIGDDAENYHDVSQYVILLDNIATLISSEIQLSNIHGNTLNNISTVAFDCKSKPYTIELKDIQSDWFKEEFLDILNTHLRSAGCEKSVRPVYLDGIDYTDQCFQLCFMSDETFLALERATPQFAGEYQRRD